MLMGNVGRNVTALGPSLWKKDEGHNRIETVDADSNLNGAHGDEIFYQSFLEHGLW